MQVIQGPARGTAVKCPGLSSYQQETLRLRNDEFQLSHSDDVWSGIDRGFCNRVRQVEMEIFPFWFVTPGALYLAFGCLKLKPGI